MNTATIKSTQELNNIIQRQMADLMQSDGYKSNFRPDNQLDYLKNGRPPNNTDIILILSTGQRIIGKYDFLRRKYIANRANQDNETKYSIHKLNIHPYVVGWEEIKKVFDSEEVYKWEIKKIAEEIVGSMLPAWGESQHHKVETYEKARELRRFIAANPGCKSTEMPEDLRGYLSFL